MMSNLQKEIADAIINAIEDVMDRYENRQFLANQVCIYDGCIAKFIKCEIDSKPVTVIIK